MDKSKDSNVLLDELVGFAKETTDAFKTQWEARKDVAKTLISLASAALIFTITFASSFIVPIGEG